jgi:hypothetical protein
VLVKVLRMFGRASRTQPTEVRHSPMPLCGWALSQSKKVRLPVQPPCPSGEMDELPESFRKTPEDGSPVP